MFYLPHLQDYGQLWRLLDDDGRYTNSAGTVGRGQGRGRRNSGGGWSSDSSSVGRESVYTDLVIAGLLGEMSEERKIFVRKVQFV